jgi:hypothetical protein
VRIEFKFGEVLPADDPLARWIVSLAMIHNDLVFANLNLMAAEEASLDWWFWRRIAMAHYLEAMNTLAEEKNVADVATLSELNPLRTASGFAPRGLWAHYSLRASSGAETVIRLAASTVNATAMAARASVMAHSSAPL